MLRYAVLGLIGLLASSALAQQPSLQTAAPGSSSSPASIEPAKTAVAMEEPTPGDHWTYEVRDEITGTVAATRTKVITEVTPVEISTRIDTLGKSNPGQIVFDRSWNVVMSGSWRYSPNAGSGIRPQLSVGKTWNFQCNELNTADGSAWKRSGKSKVVGQETVTTKAGTFETFRIETSYSARKVGNPTRIVEATSQTWYAPTINHWVKQTFVSRTDKHLLINNNVELIDYGRK